MTKVSINYDSLNKIYSCEFDNKNISRIFIYCDFKGFLCELTDSYRQSIMRNPKNKRVKLVFGKDSISPLEVSLIKTTLGLCEERASKIV